MKRVINLADEHGNIIKHKLPIRITTGRTRRYVFWMEVLRISIEVVKVLAIILMSAILTCLILYNAVLKRAWADVWKILDAGNRAELSMHPGWWEGME